MRVVSPEEGDRLVERMVAGRGRAEALLSGKAAESREAVLQVRLPVDFEPSGEVEWRVKGEGVGTHLVVTLDLRDSKGIAGKYAAVVCAGSDYDREWLRLSAVRMLAHGRIGEAPAKWPVFLLGADEPEAPRDGRHSDKRALVVSCPSSGFSFLIAGLELLPPDVFSQPIRACRTCSEKLG
jgi:hypothetical protein